MRKTLEGRHEYNTRLDVKLRKSAWKRKKYREDDEYRQQVLEYQRKHRQQLKEQKNAN